MKKGKKEEKWKEKYMKKEKDGNGKRKRKKISRMYIEHLLCNLHRAIRLHGVVLS